MNTAPTYQLFAPAPVQQVGADTPWASARDPADVTALRQPTESSRFALACVPARQSYPAPFVLVSTGHALEIGLLTPFLVPLILMSRVAWMLARIRLLVDAVQVAAASLPDVDDIVRGMRERLAYHRRLDVFVMNKISRAPRAVAAYLELFTFAANREPAEAGQVKT